MIGFKVRQPEVAIVQIYGQKVAGREDATSYRWA